MVLIKYKSGKTQQGILIALGDQCVRIAIEGSDDAALFRLLKGVWVSEDCEVVTFEFVEHGFPVQETADFREAVFPKPLQTAAIQRVM